MRDRILSACLIDTTTPTALKCDHNAFVHMKAYPVYAISKNAFAHRGQNYDCDGDPNRDSDFGLPESKRREPMAKKAAAKKPAAKPAAKKPAAKAKKK